VDDFGLHAGINQAVFALLAQGRVQAVSAMVGGPAWAAGALTLRQWAPTQVDVGLHLDFTECTLHEFAAMPHQRLLLHAYLRRLDARALHREIHAQFDAFEQAMGRAPDYVDGHQHVHQLPGIRTRLLQAIAQRYPTRKPWLRSTRSGPAAGHADWRTQAKSGVIALLGNRAMQAGAKRLGLMQNARLLGVYDFSGDAAQYRQRMQRWLAAAHDGDLLMCHPGLPEESIAANTATHADAIAAARQVEFSVLTSPAFAELLTASHVRLLPLHQIMQASRG
jgi:predicted glycoside hydrolase/deacetylase ChbG (UPF0249 family)